MWLLFEQLKHTQPFNCDNFKKQLENQFRCKWEGLSQPSLGARSIYFYVFKGGGAPLHVGHWPKGHGKHREHWEGKGLKPKVCVMRGS